MDGDTFGGNGVTGSGSEMFSAPSCGEDSIAASRGETSSPSIVIVNCVENFVSGPHGFVSFKAVTFFVVILMLFGPVISASMRLSSQCCFRPIASTQNILLYRSVLVFSETFFG